MNENNYNKLYFFIFLCISLMTHKTLEIHTQQRVTVRVLSSLFKALYDILMNFLELIYVICKA